MAEYLGPSIEDWAKKKGKNISWLARAAKAASGDPVPESVIEEPTGIPVDKEPRQVAAEPVQVEQPEPEVEIPDVAPTKPEFGHTLNKDMVWQAIIGAAPALLGAAIGGPQGGASGAQIGVESLQNLRKERLDLEKQQATEDLKREALDVSKDKVKVARVVAAQKMKRQGEQDDLAERRFKETQRYHGSMENIMGQKFDVANAKDLQNGYMKDPTVVKSEEALKQIKEAKGLIASGDASDATKVQLKIAAIYNQGRPSDTDFKAVAGSQAYWDKLSRWYEKGWSNKATAGDLAELKRTLAVMEQVNTRAKANARQRWITLGSARLQMQPKEIESILPDNLDSSYQTDQESGDEKEDLLKEINDLLAE